MPDDPKTLAEFRENNISLIKQLTEMKERYAGIDPTTVAASLAELTELKQRPDLTAKVSELEAALAAEKTAAAAERTRRVDAETKANRSRLRDILRPKLLAAGIVPAAIDIALDKAEPSFTMEGDTVTARPNTFSRNHPGEPLTPDEWVVIASRELPFLFAPSRGSGALGSRGGQTGDSGNVLRDPTAAQLGQHAKDIASGKLKVQYSGE